MADDDGAARGGFSTCSLGHPRAEQWGSRTFWSVKWPDT
jgi:hypothetical protein